MLYLHQSNHLEILAKNFSKLCQNRPLENAFASETIVVQSRGMGRFLNLFLAKEQGIAANLNFILPASFTWQLMQNVLPRIPKQSIFAPEPLSWQIFTLLPSLKEPVFAPLQHYISLSEEASFQLACKLADIYDQYLVYRPNWIREWEAGRRCNLGSDEAWQAALWLRLSHNPAPHRVRLLDQLLNNLATATKLPARLSLFGIATLAPMYLHIMQHMAQYTDVHIFALNPSAEYWGDLLEPAALLQQPEGYQDLSQSGHPLLASLGKQGRDFFDSLHELPFIQITDDFKPNPATSLLARLQNDILSLQLPEPETTAQTSLLPDDSIQIHSAHSPLRELQILKDQLLYLLEQNPHLSPDDIAVLTPKIAAYTPFIEAVFSHNTHTPNIPYHLTDTQIATSHPLLFVFNAILTLLEGRFEVDQVLDLLDAEPLRRKFKLTSSEVEIITYHVKNMNIHWALDQQMRALHGTQSNDFTWEQGLNRLTLGFMMPQSIDNEAQIPIWQHLAASSTSFSQAAVLANFIALLQTLATLQKTWQIPAAANEWVERLHQLLEALFEGSLEDQSALAQLEEAIANFSQHTALVGNQNPIGYQVIKAYLRQYLSSSQEYSLLKGGLTFCNMVPMRSLPFKVLCLIGLNDGDYPRDERAISFDLLAKHPQKGDRSRPHDDRYLFLEALLSAREKLYLSFVGRNIKTDEPLPPSPLLSELLDTLAKMTRLQPQKIAAELITEHPLQPFSKRYFNHTSNRLFSFNSPLAAALNQPITEPQTFYQQPLPYQVKTQQTWTDFCTFWRHPARYWLKHVLAIQPQYLAIPLESSEPFTLERAQAEKINNAFLEAKIKGQALATVKETLYAQNQLPAGKLGQLFEQQQRQNIAALTLPPPIFAAILAPLNFNLQLNHLTLSGTLNNLRKSGQMFSQGIAVNAPERITYALHHLLLCTLAPTNITELLTHIFSPDEHLIYTPISPQEALKLLNQWADYFIQGHTEPLPFFPRTSLSGADAYQKISSDPKKTLTAAAIKASTLKAAMNTFLGFKQYQGQNSESAIILSFAGQQPLENPLFFELIQNLIIPLQQYQQQSSIP